MKCEKLYLWLYMFISDTCIEFHCFNILQSIMSHISCTIRTCKSSKIKNPELTFFTIPDILSQKWTEVLMHHKPLAWKPKKHTKICELHFLKTSYSKHGGLMAVCWSFQRSAHSRPVGPTGQWQTSDPTYEPLWADLWKDQHTAINDKYL